MGNWPGQRIVEAIIIGTIAALGSSYVTVKVLDERVANIGQRVTALDEREARHHESVQESLRQIYALLVGRRS
jgi:hypothetical protein